MTHRTVPVIVLAALVSALALVAPAAAQSASKTAKAEKTRERAVAKVEAWRSGPAEDILDKEREALGDTKAFITADAVVRAQTALGKDDKVVNESLTTLKDQAKATPKDPVPEFYRGVVLAWLGKNDQAAGAWKGTESRARALVEADPENATAQYYLGAALIRQKKDYDAARKALDTAAANGFEQSMVDFERGLSYLLQEKWQPARESFDAVEKVEPRFAHLYFYRGLAWDKLGHKDKMLNDFDQFIRLAPSAPESKTAQAILAAAR